MTKSEVVKEIALATGIEVLDVRPDSVLLTSEDARNYERACVEEVQNKAGTKK